MNDKLVLLSDDDQSIRVVASKALAQAGYIVKTAETLSGLMDLIEHHPARVLVTDVVVTLMQTPSIQGVEYT